MDWLSAPTPLILAHRGASADAPENTLTAFALAREQGADGVELDVHLSADGWPVVIHDERVERTTSGTGRVSRLTVAELQALDAGAGQAIPTLDEVFEMLGPGFLYNVEIKAEGWRSKGIEAAVADRIEAYHLENQTVVSSFSPLVVRRARRHLTRTTLVALIHDRPLSRFHTWLARAEADHPHYSLVDTAYMERVRKQGYRVHVWTVDDPAEARRLAGLGVHAIVTNKPEFIRESLRM
ncbi:MAG TPA: glycerophosphodiester phosphodiesterase family protein [Anaerolineae bacterium]